MARMAYSLQHPTIKLTLMKLEREHRTYHELGRYLGLGPITAKTVCKWLHKRHLIHVSSWLRGHGSPLRVFAAGPGTDAPRPPPFTNSQNAKRYRLGLQRPEGRRKSRSTCKNILYSAVGA